MYARSQSKVKECVRVRERERERELTDLITRDISDNGVTILHTQQSVTVLLTITTTRIHCFFLNKAPL